MCFGVFLPSFASPRCRPLNRDDRHHRVVDRFARAVREKHRCPPSALSTTVDHLFSAHPRGYEPRLLVSPLLAVRRFLSDATLSFDPNLPNSRTKRSGRPDGGYPRRKITETNVHGPFWPVSAQASGRTRDQVAARSHRDGVESTQPWGNVPRRAVDRGSLWNELTVDTLRSGPDALRCRRTQSARWEMGPATCSRPDRSALLRAAVVPLPAVATPAS